MLDPHYVYEAHTVTFFFKMRPQTDSFGTHGSRAGVGRGCGHAGGREGTRMRRAVAAERERTYYRILCIGTVGYA